jgi:hypothetical protein
MLYDEGARARTPPYLGLGDIAVLTTLFMQRRLGSCLALTLEIRGHTELPYCCQFALRCICSRGAAPAGYPQRQQRNQDDRSHGLQTPQTGVQHTDLPGHGITIAVIGMHDVSSCQVKLHADSERTPGRKSATLA